MRTRTRYARNGPDLNREFWNNTKEPEVRLLQTELLSHSFNGIISLHADDHSDGIYGFARGATLTKNLRAAGAIIIAKTGLTELANWVAGAPTPMPGNYNGLAGFGYHARDEYIDTSSIVPRLYLMTRMLTELGKKK